MADNIRSTTPATFAAQDWQTAKVRPTPGTATPDEIAHKPTAEWANAVDEAQRDINKAFFGFPQQAVNTRGWLRGSNSADTSGSGSARTATIPLVQNVPNRDLLEVEVFIGVRRTGATAGSGTHHEIALLKSNAGTFTRLATELSTDQSDPADPLDWLTGATMTFPASVSPSTLAITVTGPDSGESLHWTVDFSIRSGPLGLPEDSIVGL